MRTLWRLPWAKSTKTNPPRPSWYAYVLAVLAVLGATALLFPFRPNLTPLSLALLYLIVVTAVSLFSDTGPSIVASLLAFLCFDFVFIPPFYTFSVAHPDDILVLLVFLGITILVTQLVVRLRAQNADVLRHARQTTTLYELSTALIGQVGLDATLAAIVRRVRRVFGLDLCAILLSEHGELAPRAVDGGGITSLADPNLLNTARWVLEKRQVAGIGSTRAKLRPPRSAEYGPLWNFAQGFRERDALLVPIATSNRPIGVLVVGRHEKARFSRDEEQQLLVTFANQAALAIERSLLTDEHLRAEVLQRSDELKSALLSAVSHDLRTPLASIKASATSLLQTDVSWTDDDRRELLTAIDEEADRLNQFVANLLDLSRIEAGALKPAFDWYDLREIIYDAVNRSEHALAGHPLAVDLPPDIRPLKLDYIEMAQIFVNVLENAGKYSPPGTPIGITVRVDAEQVSVAVRDEGVGLAAGEEERIFDRFYRVEAPNRPIGSGIGLAISRGFVEAHGGRIWAERNPDRGITVRFTLPVVEREPAPAATGHESWSGI